MAYQGLQNPVETDASSKSKISLWCAFSLVSVPALLTAGMVSLTSAPTAPITAAPKIHNPCTSDPRSLACTFRGDFPIYFH